MLPRPRLRSRLGRGLRALAGLLESGPENRAVPHRSNEPGGAGGTDAASRAAITGAAITGSGSNPSWIGAVDEAPEHWLRRVREAGQDNRAFGAPAGTHSLSVDAPAGEPGGAGVGDAGGVDSGAAARDGLVSRRRARRAPSRRTGTEAHTATQRSPAGTGSDVVEPGGAPRDRARPGPPAPSASDVTGRLPQGEPMRQWPRGQGPARLRLRQGGAVPTSNLSSSAGRHAVAAPGSAPDDVRIGLDGRAAASADGTAPDRALAQDRSGPGQGSRHLTSVVAGRIPVRFGSAPRDAVDARPARSRGEQPRGERSPGAQSPGALRQPNRGAAAPVDRPDVQAAAPASAPARVRPSAPAPAPTTGGPAAPGHEWPAPVRSSGPVPAQVAAAKAHPWPELNVPRPPRDDGPADERLGRGLARARRLAVEESRV